MRKGLPLVLLAFLAATIWLIGTRTAPIAPPAQGERPVATQGTLPHTDSARSPLPSAQPAGFLPREAIRVVALIRQGGPFPHRQDGGVFANREAALPRRPRGWYREYTVETPGLGHRGARRIVTGGTPPTQWYYTDDHYESFRPFEAGGTRQ